MRVTKREGRPLQGVCISLLNILVVLVVKGEVCNEGSKKKQKKETLKKRKRKKQRQKQTQENRKKKKRDVNG